MFSKIVCVAAGISSLTQNVLAYPSGPGTCTDDMSSIFMSSRYQKFPGQSGGNPKQSFKIHSPSGDWSGKDKVAVSVLAPGTENIKGFVVYAEDMQGNRVGSFDDVQNVAATPTTCQDRQGAIGHSRRIMLNQIDLNWNPPAEGVGPVTFKGVVLSGFNAFWNPKELTIPETPPEATTASGKKSGKKTGKKSTKKGGKKGGKRAGGKKTKKRKTRSGV